MTATIAIGRRTKRDIRAWRQAFAGGRGSPAFPPSAGRLGRLIINRRARMTKSSLLLSLCALAACAGLEAGSAEAHLGQSPAAKSAPHSRSPSDDQLILQSYPRSHYRGYPAVIRSSLRRADIEHSRCAGNPGDFRACDRMDRIVRQLERRGWCWGSAEPMAAESDKYWLRCSNDPHFRRR